MAEHESGQEVLVVEAHDVDVVWFARVFVVKL